MGKGVETPRSVVRPPLRLQAAPSADRIPEFLTPIIGRADEVRVILGLARNPASRLIVLTGPGGVGKTRLALDIARRVRDSGDRRVWYVELASVRDPSLVIPTVAHALGIWDGAQAPVSDRLVRLIGQRDAMLVLDNFEQVANAAPLLTDLLATCPNLTILVTSRTVLRLSGEHTIALQPLAHSDDDTQSEAVKLFAERAAEANATFALTDDNLPDIVAICARLEGLPLAIELAAARTALTAAEELLPRLDNRLASLGHHAQEVHPRLRTMGDAIDWSYRLLDPPDQRLFARLSVFEGGFSIDAARMVGFDRPADDDWAAIEHVSSLLDQSLLDQQDGPGDEPRFTMLETIREYAFRQLADQGDVEQVRSRHAAWCLAFAQGIRSTFAFQHDAVWRDRLEAELGNLRAALHWHADRDEVEDLLALATALFPLWHNLGRGREGVAWLLDGLGRADDVAPEVVLRAVRVAAELIAEQCDHDTANALAERAIVLARQLGDTRALAESIFLIGKNAQLSGDVDGGRARIEEALTLFEAVGHEPGIAHTQTYLAMLGGGMGAQSLDDPNHLDRARQCWETELELFTTTDNVPLIARAIHGLAYVAHLAGDQARALELSHDALRRRWATGDIRVFPAEFEDIADICNATEQYEQAARLYGAASALRARLDTPIPWWFEAEYQQELDRSRSGLSARQFASAWSAGEALSIKRALDEALAVRLTPVPPQNQKHPFDLTSREIEVLRLLSEGDSNQEIAAELFISPKTAANHVANILSKLDADSRTAAASIALRHQLV